MTLDKSSARVKQMFGEIAGRYDFLNRTLSLGIDRSWRRKTVKLVPPEGNAPILDVCTGTADLALAYWRAGGGKVPIVGTDFCGPMLTLGREKCRQAGSFVGQESSDVVVQESPDVVVQASRLHAATETRLAVVGTVPPFPQDITLLEADTQHLPFPDDTFQIVCVAFGLRNVCDTDAGLREMVRVCQPGGRVAVLEFSTPTLWPLGAVYAWYFQHVLPRIGQALARNTQSAYNYLPQSVGRFPQGEALAERMRATGLDAVWFKPFTFGVATLYVGKKQGVPS